MAKVGLAFMLVVLAAGAASAAAPVRVSLARPVSAADVGQPWTSRLAVRPAAFRGRIKVTAVAGARRVAAAASRSAGTYRMRLVFPAAGRWTLTARAGGRLSRLGTVVARPAPRTPLVLTEPTNIELEPAGTLLVVENSIGRVVRVDPAAGAVDVLASGLTRPFGVARASSGALFVSGGPAIRRLDGAGALTTVAETEADTGPLTVAADGDVVYTTATGVFRLAGGTGTPVHVAGTGVAGGGGDGGPATSAQVSAPHGIAVAADGALLVADTGNDRIRRIDPTTGVITTLAQIGIPDGMDVAADGTIYVVDGRATRVVHLSATGERLGFSGSTYTIPYDVEAAPDGTVYVLEAGPSGRIKRVARDGTVTTVSRG